MEYWDAYDIDGQPLGETLVRDRPIPAGRYHIVVEVVTLTPDGRLLLTRRDPRKPFGLKWEITGGSALAGEDAPTGAVRELFEETGIRVSRDELIPVAAFPTRDCLFRTFAVVKDVAPADIVLQEGETIDFKFVRPEVFASMCEAGDVARPIADRLDEYLGIVKRLLR